MASLPSACQSLGMSLNACLEAIVPVDLSAAWQSGQKILDSAIALLPKLILAIIVFVIFLIIGSVVQSSVRRLLQRRNRRQNLALLIGQLAYICVSVFGFLVALSIVAPSFSASDLIKVLGIGGVAIGFAFQNILQNFLAGILLLLQEPFVIGDWINSAGLEGKVEDIQTRATIVSTADGKRVVIPNAVLFTSPVVVGQPSQKQEKSEPAPAVAHTP